MNKGHPGDSPPARHPGRGVRVRRRNHSPAPARAEAGTPSAAAIIPFSRDTDFIEREGLFQVIQQKCTVPGSRTALVGLGGVGKSQLAIELAYQTRDRSPNTWIFWVHASSAARFQQSFQNIATCVKVPGWESPEANVYQLVHDWLQDTRNGKWLIVLDNVDDGSFLLETRSAGNAGQAHAQLEDSQEGENSQPLISYLPQCQNGSVLITTRNKNEALKFAEQRSIVMIDPMNKKDSIALLQKKLGEQDENEISDLASALEYMPLAIVQAAAFIVKRQPRYSVKRYLNDFQKSDSKSTNLLDYDGGQLRRDWEAKNSVIITWQISFDHIRKVRPSAADLLSLMSFYDCHGIPENLLQNPRAISQQAGDDGNSEFVDLGEGDGTESEFSLEDGFEEDIDILRGYSFISISPDGSTFEMHRLVQLATRKWLKSDNQLEKWKNVFIKNLSAEFPSGDYETWMECQMYFPHVKSAATQRPKSQEVVKDWSLLMYNAAFYAYKLGNSVEAEQMSTLSFNTRKALFGLEHEDTLRSMTLLGIAYDMGAKLKEAEELFEEVIGISKKILGSDHVLTLSAMYHLASTYKDQGRWDAAETLAQQALDARKRKLGAQHLDTLASMHSLAFIYKIQGRWSTAEELFVELINIYKKLGMDQHPDMLACMASLVSTYENQGRWKDAEKLGLEVLATMREKMGPEHPSTLDSMNNLEMIYWNQGRFDAAEELGVQVLEICKTKFGSDHPNTLVSMGNLATIYWDRGLLNDAERLEVEVVELITKRLGEYHPDTLSSMNNLAMTYRNQGKWDAAEELSQKVVHGYQNKLGIDYPETLKSMMNLAAIYSNQGKYTAAEELEVEVTQKSILKLGEEHPDTLQGMGNLALTYRNQGKLDAAQELTEKVLRAYQKNLGEDHPDTLISMINLGMIVWDQGRWDAAEQMQVETVELSTKRLGGDHTLALSAKANLASTYRKRGKLDKAEKLSTEVLAMRKEKFGDDHPDNFTIMDTLAQTYAEQGRLDAALDLGTVTLDGARKKLGDSHPDTIKIMQTLASIYTLQGRLQAAEELNTEALNASKKLPKGNLTVLDVMAALALKYRKQNELNAAEDFGQQVVEGRTKKYGAGHFETLYARYDLACTWKAQGRDVEAVAEMKECIELYQQSVGVSHPRYILASQTLVEWDTEKLSISNSS